MLTGSSLGSLESLSNEYTKKFPEDSIGNNILRNMLRKMALGIDEKSDYATLTKYFLKDIESTKDVK
jgi:hypothetical protein